MSKQGTTRKISKPGKVISVFISCIPSLEDDQTYHVHVKREHDKAGRYYMPKSNSVVFMWIERLIDSGSVRNYSTINVYPTFHITRTVEDLALEAMGSD